VPPAPVFQISMQIAKAVPGRIDRLVVQLEPAALGRVEVRLKSVCSSAACIRPGCAWTATV
jgi:hypothetical protein